MVDKFIVIVGEVEGLFDGLAKVIVKDSIPILQNGVGGWKGHIMEACSLILEAEVVIS